MYYIYIILTGYMCIYLLEYTYSIYIYIHQMFEVVSTTFPHRILLQLDYGFTRCSTFTMPFCS